MTNTQELNNWDIGQRILERSPLSDPRPLIIDGTYHDPDEWIVRELALITAKGELEADPELELNTADQQLFEIVCYALELSGCLEPREHIEAIWQQATAYIEMPAPGVDGYSPASLRVLTDVDRVLQAHARCLEEIDGTIRNYRGCPASKKAQLAQQQSEPDIQTAACYQEIEAMEQLATKGARLFEPETLQDAKLVLTALIEREVDDIGHQPIIET